MASERVRPSERPLLHEADRYILNRRGAVSGFHLARGAVGALALDPLVRDDIAFAKTQAAVVQATKDVWDRAEAITEQGTFLTERLEGLVQRIQLDFEVQGELDLIHDTRTTLALAPDDPNQFSSIRQNAQEIASQVARIEGNLNSPDQQVWYSSIKQTADLILSEVARIEGTLNSPDSQLWYSSIKQTAEEITSEVARIEGALNSGDPDMWYSSIKQTADLILSEVARIEGNLNSPNAQLWYSSIKQTADSIESVVATLQLGADHPNQFSSIRQTAVEIESIVTTLNSTPDAQGQFSSISQTASQIASIVGILEGNPDDANQFSAIRQNAQEIDLRVRFDEVISAINLSPEGVRILGSRIVLDGDVEVLGTFKVGEANIDVLSVGTIHLKNGAVTEEKLGFSNVRIESGTYVGNHILNRHIDVGFVPKLVLVTAAGRQWTVIGDATVSHPKTISAHSSSTWPFISGTGFRVGVNDDGANGDGITYTWVAVGLAQ